MEMDFLYIWSMIQAAPDSSKDDMADKLKKMPGEVTTVSTGMIRSARPRGKQGSIFPDVGQKG